MSRIRAGVFAVALLLPAVLVLGYGLAGSTGNSLVTGVVIAALIGVLALTTLRRPDGLQPGDLAFAAMVAAVAISTWTAPAPRNEMIAMALTLASYVAARNLSLADLPALRASIIMLAGAVTAIGTPLTAIALVEQWSDPHGHPIVLGLPSAATMLAIAAGYLAIAATTDRLDRRRTIIWCVVLFVPVAVLAASQIRFALMAALGAVLVAAVVQPEARQRRGALVLALAIVLATACGLASRHQTSAKFMNQFRAVAEAATQSVIPSAAAASSYVPAHDARIECGIEADNSLAIRKALIREALTLAQQAGPFGFGLDGFLARSCLGMVPHNVILQALIETGWIGGAALALMMAVAAWRLLPLARQNPSTTFLFCTLAYAIALSMVHGRLSRQGDLFLLLGAATGAVASQTAPRRGEGTQTT